MLSQLHKVWERAGVDFMEIDGAERPRRFGTVADEVQLARTSVAVCCLPPVSFLRVTGKHRLRFLHNMTTCEIKKLESGQGNFGMIVDGGGKLVAMFFVDADEDTLLMELAPDRQLIAKEQMERYRVADRVVFTPEAERTVFAVVGATAADTLTTLVGEFPQADWHWVDTMCAGVPVRVRHNRVRTGLPGYDLTVSDEQAGALWEALAEAGVSPIGQEAWSVLSVESGWPRDGVDMGEGNIPLEAERLAPGIDWDKGCYIGQEVIAMMHYRGKPNKHLRGVLYGGDEGLAGKDVFSSAGKKVGTVGRVVQSPGFGKALGLCVIKRKHAEPGTELQLENGESVEVVTLPVAD